MIIPSYAHGNTAYIYILNLAVGNYLKAEAVIGQLSFGRSLKK